jgi:hypothetical protein
MAVAEGICIVYHDAQAHGRRVWVEGIRLLIRVLEKQLQTNEIVHK